MNSGTIGRPMEILLVEDCLADARLTIENLKDSGIRHRLTLIRDGDEAVEFLGQQQKYSLAPQPDLILLDMHLPKRDGRHILRFLQTDFDLQQTPVVVLSGSDIEAHELRGEGLEVKTVLMKPVDPTAFVTLVQRLKRFWLFAGVLPA